MRWLCRNKRCLLLSLSISERHKEGAIEDPGGSWQLQPLTLTSADTWCADGTMTMSSTGISTKTVYRAFYLLDECAHRPPLMARRIHHQGITGYIHTYLYRLQHWLPRGSMIIFMWLNRRAARGLSARHSKPLSIEWIIVNWWRSARGGDRARYLIQLRFDILMLRYRAQLCASRYGVSQCVITQIEKEKKSGERFIHLFNIVCNLLYFISLSLSKSPHCGGPSTSWSGLSPSLAEIFLRFVRCLKLIRNQLKPLSGLMILDELYRC